MESTTMMISICFMLRNILVQNMSRLQAPPKETLM